MKSHNLIAVLGAEVNEAYQAELWKGISAEAENHDKYLICFMGSRSGIPYRETHISFPFYGLAHSDNFDGVIIVSSTISTYMDPEKVRALFETRPHIPKISIGMPMVGAGSVCVDGRKGMGEMVEHLADDHNCSRFALIAGPRLHPESEQRRKIVEKILGERSIALNESDIYYGRFDKESGYDGAEFLFRGNNSYDALLCLNDRMAIGALEALENMGKDVPGAVKVSGFDGIEEAAYCSPPLSTVIQPLRELGKTSVKELYRVLDGSKPRNLNLESHVHLRQSCSCRTPLFLDSKGKDGAQEIETFRLLGGVPPFEGKWEGKTRRLVHSFLKEEERGHLLRNVGITLSGSFELDALYSKLAKGLALLGFRYAFLVLYDTNGKEGQSRLVFELNEGKLLTCGETGIEFPSREILPSISAKLRETDCRNWMFSPLAFQDKLMGHLLLPGDHPDTELYETLARQISSSLQGAILWEQVKNHEQDLLEEVKKRTVELIRVNDNLRKEIEQRKKLEEEVLEISRHTMERIGQDLHDDLCQYLAGTSLKLSAVIRRLDSGNGDMTLPMEEVREMLNDSITRAKRIVKGLVPLGIKEEGFNNALKSLCLDMSRSYGVAIEYGGMGICDELSPERTTGLYRIVQEALNNAVKHSGSKRIAVIMGDARSEKREEFTITIRDWGSGFSPDGERGTGGMGLRIMRYRGRRIGVHVEIQSDTGGTTVICRGVE